MVAIKVLSRTEGSFPSWERPNGNVSNIIEETQLICNYIHLSTRQESSQYLECLVVIIQDILKRALFIKFTRLSSCDLSVQSGLGQP